MSKSHFDLVVVGAGILGTFHAYHAAKMGKTVLLTEKDQYPVNATVRNFGQAVPSGMASDWFEYGTRGVALYKHIQKDFDISVRNNGTVYIASDPEEQQLIHELKAVMDQRNYPAELLSTAGCLERWPALKPEYCREAIFFPTEVSIEPERLIYRVLEYVQAKFSNLTYLPSTTIVGCDSSDHSVQLTASDGRKFTGDQVIICNGGEFKLLFAGLFRESGIVISKLQMLRTHPMPEVPLEGNILTGLTIRRYESFEACPSFKTTPTPAHLQELKKWGIHILFKKAEDGSIIIGDSHEYATVNESDNLGFTIREDINELMLKEASRIVNFNVRNIATTWAGFYPQHPDKDIVEYDIDSRIHIRTAIGGKGMTTSAGYAEASVRRIFGVS